MDPILLTNDQTFFSLGMMGTILTGVALVLYHYFFTRNNINFLINESKQVKTGLTDLSEAFYNTVDNRIKDLETKYIDKIKLLNNNLEDQYAQLNNIIDELKNNDVKYKENLLNDIKQTNNTVYYRIDELREKIATCRTDVTKLETNIEIMLSNNIKNNDGNYSVNNLKELFTVRTEAIERIMIVHRTAINDLHNKVFTIAKEIK